MLKKILKIVLPVLPLLIIAFFVFAPAYIDASMNQVSGSSDVPPNPQYDSLPFVADLHCDMLLWDRDFFSKNNKGHVDLARMQAANVALQAFTIVSKTPRGINIESNSDETDQIALLSFVQLRPPSTWFSMKARAMHQIDQLYDFAEESNGAFRVITSGEELSKFMEDRKVNPKLTAGMLGMEGAHCLEADPDNLVEFYKKGVRYIGLTHFFDNEWAGSAHGLKKDGLTPEGRKLIQKMDSLGIIIDLAHSSPKTIDEIFELHQGPLIVSHTGVKGTCDNKRNLSDRQILEIGKRSGLIGIGLWETAVCGTDAKATARSMKYVADKIGVDKVCLGSDFDGAITAPFDTRGLPLIMQELKALGFNQKEVELMMGGNIRDFMLKNL